VSCRSARQAAGRRRRFVGDLDRRCVRAILRGRGWMTAQAGCPSLQCQTGRERPLAASTAAEALATPASSIPVELVHRQGMENGRCPARRTGSFASSLPDQSKPAPSVIPAGLHSRGSEGVAPAVAGQGSFSTSQSNSDYAARGERGDPRGRKSGSGPGAANPRWPARAQGEKRFRSATRNPYAAMHSVA